MSQQARRRSASFFGNDKIVEVVLALDRERPLPTAAQELARPLSINHDLVRKVLGSLIDAGLVKTLPRVGGSRGRCRTRCSRQGGGSS